MREDERHGGLRQPTSLVSGLPTVPPRNRWVPPPVGARNRNPANYFRPRRKTIPAPIRKLSWRLLRPSGILVMKYSAVWGEPRCAWTAWNQCRHPPSWRNYVAAGRLLGSHCRQPAENFIRSSSTEIFRAPGAATTMEIYSSKPTVGVTIRPAGHWTLYPDVTTIAVDDL